MVKTEKREEEIMMEEGKEKKKSDHGFLTLSLTMF